MVITSDGNVGIGTTSPESGAKLDVRAGSGGKIVLGSYDANYKIVVEGGDQLNFYNGTSGATAYINYGATGTPANVLVSRNLFVEANSSGGVNGTIRIKSDGNVGIGTTSPNQVGYGASTKVLSLKANTSGGESVLELIGLGNADNDQVGVVNFMSQSDTTPLASIKGLRHTSDSSGKLSFETAAVERMRIDSSGNVGIGYTGLYNQISGGENTLAIGDADNASLYLKSDATGGHNHILFSGTGGSLSFYDKTRGDYNMIIDNVGNVGIGTTSPNSLLELDGAIGIGGASGDSNVSISTTAFTAQFAGSLHINWGVQGSAANGSTVVFTYAATSWKSWTLKYILLVQME